MGESGIGKSVFVTEFEGGALTRVDTAIGARTVVDLARLLAVRSAQVVCIAR